jgi:aminoglycoside phosphotransferase family enzyme
MADTMKTVDVGFRERKRECKLKRKQSAAAGVSCQQKIARLRERDAWTERIHRVDVIETHLSWVFLTAWHAWKLKKPGRYEAIDLRSVAARKRNEQMELRLNRRLSRSVYLGVDPLTLGGNGVMRVGGKGKVIDWLLKMRRLPAGLMLDRALARGAVHKSDTAKIVRRLSSFYRSLPRSNLRASAYRARFLSEIARNESVLVRIMICRAADVRQLCDIQRALLASRADRLELRVADGWIRECHGDLRPEHVCLTRPVAIIDCLEFSERLRTIDTLDEVGFLALECEHLGASTIAHALLAAYGGSMHDSVDAGLLHFYQSIRATVRARLAAAHLLGPRIGRVRHWRRRALAYLEIGAAHARQCAAALQPGARTPTPDLPPIGVTGGSLRCV